MSQTDLIKLGFTKVPITFLMFHTKYWKKVVLDFKSCKERKTTVVGGESICGSLYSFYHQKPLFSLREPEVGLKQLCFTYSNSSCTLL